MKKEEIKQDFSCESCKYEKWSEDSEGSFCNKHKHYLDEMFSDKFNLTQIGCKQFKKRK